MRAAQSSCVTPQDAWPQPRSAVTSCPGSQEGPGAWSHAWGAELSGRTEERKHHPSGSSSISRHTLHARCPQPLHKNTEGTSRAKAAAQHPELRVRRCSERTQGEQLLLVLQFPPVMFFPP